MKSINLARHNLLTFAALMTSMIYLFACLRLIFKEGDPRAMQLIIGAFIPASLVTYVVLEQFRKSREVLKTQNWLIDAVNWNIERLRAHGLCRLPEPSESGEGAVPMPRWPWGTHHTEYLGHLEAAARKWWNLYDPSDPTTAPTNDMVSEWLQTERNLSREKARAIASMLRPDGLPTGPRR